VKSKLIFYYTKTAIIFLLILVCNSTIALCQDNSKKIEPRTVLSEAIQAIKALESVSYEATYEMALSGGKTLFVKGRVEVGRGGVTDKMLPGKVIIKSEGYGGAQEISFDGKIARRLDHNKKILMEGLAEKGGVAVALSSGISLLQWNFIWAEPLRFENAATAAEYVGQASVGGVPCHVIDLKYSVEGTDISGGRWWFAVTDKLPRMFQTIENSQEGRNIRELRITNLQIGKAIPDAKFKIELPEGYAYRTFTPTAPNAKLIPVGAVAPDWTLTDKNGRQQKLSDLRGKVVVLEFWASWCGYCRLSIPAMQKLHEKFADKGVQVLGINFQELEGADPIAYLKSRNATYSTLLSGEKVADVYGVTSVPAFLVIDQNGKVTFAAPQFNPNVGNQLEEAINKALSENSRTSAVYPAK
jgi:cytochrome c biogenesis protein CcmG, thiol:disulfide interchange protein DsbE